MASRVTYQNISPEVTRKPWRVMSPDADRSPDCYKKKFHKRTLQTNIGGLLDECTHKLCEYNALSFENYFRDINLKSY